MSRLQSPAGEMGADSSGTKPGDMPDVIPMGDVDDDADDGSSFESTGEDAKPEAKKPEPKKAAPAKAETIPEDKDLDPDNPDAELTDEEKELKAEAEAAKGKGEKKDTRIPLGRHKELLNKEREKREALERELQATRQGKAIAQTNAEITAKEEKILELEASYNKLLADGDVDKATAAMRQLRQLDREVADARSDLKIAAAETRAVENTRYSITLERIEAAYPELNEDHEDYDADKVADVLDLQAAYVNRRRMTASAALQAAVEKLMGKSTAKQKEAIEVTARVPKAEEKDEKDLAKETADRRKAEAVKKTVAALGKTPPDASKQGADSDKHGGGAVTAADIMKMSDEELSKLDPKVLARARGDEL